MFLIFDTETTGLPGNLNAALTDLANWPRMVQLAWEVHDETGKLVEAKNRIIKPEGYTIPYSAEKIHGISTDKALQEGENIIEVLNEFSVSAERSKVIIGHNVEFDTKILGAEYLRNDLEAAFLKKNIICTKITSTDFCALPGGRNGKYKWPNLAELHTKLFSEQFAEAHNASADVAATARCFLELYRLGVISPKKLGTTEQSYTEFIKLNPTIIPPVAVEIISNKDPQNEIDIKPVTDDLTGNADDTGNIPFTHLHVHTQYSILDGAADIPGLVRKAKDDGMDAMAITDHGNMFGVKEFHNTCKKSGIKPILGCEVYIARRSRFDKSEKTDGGGFHLVLLAKNITGYRNLIRLVSYGWTEGFYYKPRIDKELLKKYNEGLIATSACLNGEIPYIIRHENKENTRKAIEEYKSVFKDDFYLELQQHPSDDPKTRNVFEDQVFVNKQLIGLAKETATKLIATNDVHFINREDAAAHDRLLCISTGKDVDDPSRMRYTQQEWFKTKYEMRELFAAIPEALENTREIADKVELYELDSDPVMPDFPIPDQFETEDDYLRHITYEGAEERYSGLTDEIKNRIDFELETIKKMGFPGYFLIVWDFIKAARELGVSVGPGRGSAAGSAVAYCLKITDIDPIKYDLLFERFLNPDRISMPDIDIDFDEDGREKVLQWVVNKYGKNRVAHIITFGTMAPKMAIRDVARVQKLELAEADRLAKLIPERPGTTFVKAYREVPELEKERHSSNELISSTLKYAEVLEGSVRQTGVHACGIIIGRDDLEKYIPISTNKDADLFVTQYDGKHIESVGMLKMDFLGLKTLSIIKDAVDNIKISKGIDIDINDIPLDDPLTFELYSKGETTGLFQFESDGMKKHLRTLKPNRFADLIAMNALYRPGPMEYIPQYIARKHGKEKIVYDLPEMEEYLKDTYGITVYQEQVMLLSQKLAGFTKGMADSLRKAMGKKIRSMMDNLKEKFIEGCRANGYNENIALKIWSDWEAFAQYAFNKSHSTCYAYVSYQTAYLKAHYPAEFMAAVLSRNLNDIKKISFFMDECRRMGAKVLVPDINESFSRFTVNKEGNIRFGLAAIKGVGESAVEHIIEERNKNGHFTDIYNFVERVNLATVNKRCTEALIMAGGFDSFPDIKRHQYFEDNDKEESFLEKLIKYGSKMQGECNAAPTLFGDIVDIEIARPVPADKEEWPHLAKLNKEKEVIGIYLSAHPLDNFKLEINSFCNTTLSELKNLSSLKGKDVILAGIVIRADHSISKKGNPYGIMVLEDYTDSYRINLFGKDYETYRNFMFPGYSLFLKGTVQERTWPKDSTELEFKLKSITMLANVKEEMIRSLSIRMSLDNLTDELIQNLQQVLPENGGKTDLKFYIVDEPEGLGIKMFSRNHRVNLSDRLIHFLENTPELEFKVN